MNDFQNNDKYPTAHSEINTGGGTYIGGNVDVGSDFIGRDRIENCPYGTT